MSGLRRTARLKEEGTRGGGGGFGAHGLQYRERGKGIFTGGGEACGAAAVPEPEKGGIDGEFNRVAAASVSLCF